MIYLILCVLFSSAIFIAFKFFAKFNIDTFQAIIINYFTAFTIGYLSYDNKIIFVEIPNQPWFVGALILSVLFILVFNVMGLTSQKNGVSVASVASKMSIIIPVLSGICLYKEQLNIQKILGVVFALFAVYMVITKGKTSIKKNTLIFPLLLFFGSGIIDTFLKYTQNTYVANAEVSIFSATIFLLAGIIGLTLFLIKRKKEFSIKNGIGGIILGVVNYYSVYYLLKALDTDSMLSSEVFTLNNVAIVGITTILGLLLFKEKLLIKNWVGIGFAIISIVLITS